MIRVLHLHSGNVYGGVEALMVALARAGDADGLLESHYALCFDGRLSRELTACGTRVVLLGDVRTRRPASVLRARRVLAGLLAGGRYDLAIVHSSWSHAMFGPVVRAAGLPLVCWLHAATDGRHWLDRWARRTIPDFAICNSACTRTALANLHPDTAAGVVYPPVVPPPPTGARDRALVRAGFETPLTATVIVQASRMEAGKGHAVHLEALGRLRDSPDWVCWVVGGAQSRAEERYAERLRLDAARLGIADRVRFVGQRADVPRLLAAADVHCQPNVRPDSFGVAFVEALYAGLPVVTSALGGALEIVDASCGVLLPPGDAGALAASLRTLIDDPPRRRALGAAGPSRARSLCDPGQQVRRLAEALAGVAGAAVS